MNVPIRMFYNDPYQNLSIDLYPGKQLLNGRRAEMFMRFRYNDDGTGYPNGDIDRIAAQKTLYNAVMDKLISGSTVLKAPKILGIISDNVKTDFSIDEIVGYMTRIPKFSMEKVNIYTLPGEGAYDSNGVSYFFHNEEETEKLIKESFSAKRKTEPSEQGYTGSFKNRFIKVRIVDASGLSESQADMLKIVSDAISDYGFKIVSTEKSDRISDKSVFINHNEKHAATELEKVFGAVEISETIEEYVVENGEKMADVTLRIGSDFSF